MTAAELLPIPDEVLEIARTLEAAGHEAWCVGGALRDALLDQPHSDYDFATSATPAEVTRLFRRTAPIGKKYGTVGVIDPHRVLHEVTTFRRDVTTDGRHAVVAYGVSLEDDLARRDFTINALAYHPLRHEWRDPFDGRADLAAGVVRAVGEPAERFREDYLRILRGVRFAARLGFTIDPATWSAAVAAAPGLAQLSAERVRDEWFKSLRTARDLAGLVELWVAVGAAACWLPELADAPLDRIAAATRPAPEVRDPVLLTALLVDDGAAVLRRLRGANAEVERAAAITRGPAAPSAVGVAAVRRWLAATGSAADDLLALHALRGGPAPWAGTVRAIRERGDPLTRAALAIDGRDLQALGVSGRRVGEVLGVLLERVLDDPGENQRDQLLAHARELV